MRYNKREDPIVWRGNDGTTIRKSEYEEAMRMQDGRCAICGEKMNPPCVDHDHVGRFFRGLLCLTCNAGLGMLRDSPRILAAAMVYLEERGVPYLGTNRDLRG